MLVDVIVSVTTNKTPEQIQSIFDEKTDAGQRTHYAVSSTGNAIMTVMAGAAIIKDLPEIAEKLGENIKKVKTLAKNFAKSIDDAVAKLQKKAIYVLEGTGEYATVGGHHPLAKAAFDGVKEYDYKKAFSVSQSTLEDAWKTANNGIPQNIHAKLTGQQNSLYSAWKKANPNSKLTIDDMTNIEIQAMKNVGIPEDVATGWVVKALEDIKAQGVTGIKNIPWNVSN
jgi:hypothetical protein